MPDPLLEARQVFRRFRLPGDRVLPAVDGVSVSVARGSFTVLSGASGSGKSTLLGLLGALDRPSEGEVLFDGIELSKCSDVRLARLRRRVGFVFQNFSLLPRLAVWESVGYGLIPQGVPATERRERARQLLARLGLEDRLDQRPEQLSGGEQQRVAVARALIGRPELILADEPTSNLDRRSAEQMLSILRDLHEDGLTVVVATHDPALMQLATQHFELDHGRLRIAGQPEV